jgi:hypothetical protein
MNDNKRSPAWRIIAALFFFGSLAGAASAADIAVQPDFEGRYVSAATVVAGTTVVQVVLHHCNGERTVFGAEELPALESFPISAGGVLLAGVTVMAGDGVKAVAFSCPSGDDPAAVSASRPRAEGDPIEGALF